MGVNAFRTSHNLPSAEMIDVCERLGIVMMVGAFNTWDVRGAGKLPFVYTGGACPAATRARTEARASCT